MARLCKIIFCLMSVLFLVDSVICADADPPSNDVSDVPAPQSPADSDASTPPSPPNDLSGTPASPPPKPNELNSPPATPPSTNAPAPSLPKHSPTPSPSSSDNPNSPTPAPRSRSDGGAADDKKSPAPSPDAEIKHVTADTRMEEKSRGPSSSGGMSGVKKLGISVGVILFAGIIAAGVILYKKRQDNIARSRYAYAAGGTFL